MKPVKTQGARQLKSQQRICYTVTINPAGKRCVRVGTVELAYSFKPIQEFPHHWIVINNAVFLFPEYKGAHVLHVMVNCVAFLHQMPQVSIYSSIIF
jgi:hypothetical protein